MDIKIAQQVTITELVMENQKLKQERDEAREAFVIATDQMVQAQCQVREARATIEDAKRALNATDYEGVLLAAMRVKEERDEAREAIPAGEWVAHEDYKKIHEAASRLCVAINKELPIGCFTLVSSEYYRLQNAIYGREETK